MRKRTLAIVSFVIAFPIAYLVPEFLASYFWGIDLDRTFGVTTISSLIAGAIITVILTPLNNRLLAWRKTRGRDIVEEERYETESGMVRLTPNSDSEAERQ